MLQSYILCFGEDGRVVLENLNSEQFCCNYSNSDLFNLFYSSASFYKDHNNCEDISLTESCDEEKLIIKVKNVTNFFNLILFIDYAQSNSNNFSIIIKSEKLDFSPQLSSYKTVSLLI